MPKVGAMIYKAQNCKKFNSTKLTIFTLACKNIFWGSKICPKFPDKFFKVQKCEKYNSTKNMVFTTVCKNMSKWYESINITKRSIRDNNWTYYKVSN